MGNDFDVIVVGAGPAGSLCARTCARFGLKTALLERRGEEEFGYPFVVEVERTAFSACQVPMPQNAEIPYEALGIKVFTASGRFAFEQPRPATVPVRLNLTMRRFARYASREGAQILWGTTADSAIVEGADVRGVNCHSERGEPASLRACAVVDATGNAATLIRTLPAECGLDFTEHLQDRVVAENRMYEIDSSAAKLGAAKGRFVPEHLNTRVGVRGPYSTEMSIISIDRNFAYILVGLKESSLRTAPATSASTGSERADDRAAGPRAPTTPATLIEAWRERVDCCTKLMYGGRGIIRVRRPSLRLVCNGFAAVGEAASTVIPMHGSGVASAMITGHTLGLHLGAVLGRGGCATTRNLWLWAAEFQRQRGRILAYYDAARRIAEQVDQPEDLETMLLSGLMSAEDMRASSIPCIVRPSLTSLPARALACLRHPVLAARLARHLTLPLSVVRWWDRYPTQWCPQRFDAWKHRAQSLLP